MAFITAIPSFSAHHSLKSVTCPIRPSLRPRRRACTAHQTMSASASSPSEKALIFDCDGVIVESEELHRLTYNQCWKAEGLDIEWSVPLYEMLQNKIGGGREKMIWYFNKHGWPADADSDEKKEAWLDRLVASKLKFYKQMIDNGEAEVRPGVLRVMDEAYERGLKLAICSAANEEGVRRVLDKLVGKERLKKFDVILAGDMVSKKKPDPLIYHLAKDQLKVKAEDCVVIEDSRIGLLAGLGAGMRVVITHTHYTKDQNFEGATKIYEALGDDVGVDELFPELASVVV